MENINREGFEKMTAAHDKEKDEFVNKAHEQALEENEKFDEDKDRTKDLKKMNDYLDNLRSKAKVLAGAMEYKKPIENEEGAFHNREVARVKMVSDVLVMDVEHVIEFPKVYVLLEEYEYRRDVAGAYLGELPYDLSKRKWEIFVLNKGSDKLSYVKNIWRDSRSKSASKQFEEFIIDDYRSWKKLESTGQQGNQFIKEA